MKPLFLTFLLAAVLPLRADDWPQWLGPQRDGVWRETGILEKFPPDGLKIRWRVPIGNGYSGPSVVNGRVYVMDRVASRVPPAPGQPRGLIPGSERVLCLNEADGKILWKHEYDCPYDLQYPSGPRVTPLVHQGKVYTVGAEGNLFCLDAQDGRILWSHDYKQDYQVRSPTWGFSSNPLIDGRKLICLAGGQGSVAVAFDKDTGKELWRALSAREPGYCPPVIVEAGGRRQLIIWHPESVNALDPETGAVFWSVPFAVKAGLTAPMPRQDGDRLFLTSFYNGPLMLQLSKDRPAVTELWRGTSSSERNTDKLHSIIATPFLQDGHIYGVCSYGQFRCLKATTGERVWESLVPTGGKSDRWATTFIVKHGDRFFLPNEKGDLLLAKLSPKGYEEISRTHLIDPTNHDPRRPVVWSHPAFANRCIYARNDGEILCASLAAAADGK
jgi:outer membrane protein assembly factor BamB